MPGFFFCPAETPGHGRSGSGPPPEGELPSFAKARALLQIPVILNDESLAEASHGPAQKFESSVISINVRPDVQENPWSTFLIVFRKISKASL